jgi:hypothetical protein
MERCCEEPGAHAEAMAQKRSVSSRRGHSRRSGGSFAIRPKPPIPSARAASEFDRRRRRY